MRWWGSFDAAADDVCDYALEIGSDVPGGNADGLDAFFPRPLIAACIPRRIVSKVVSEAIYLDRHCGGFAEEVEHERTEGVLAPKLQPFRAQAKHAPESDL